jgi:hypothetical protein
MQQKLRCVCGGFLKLILVKRTRISRREKCGRVKQPERPRPVRRPA